MNSFFVTTSKALVTSSVALVPSSVALVTRAVLVRPVRATRVISKTRENGRSAWGRRGFSVIHLLSEWLLHRHLG